MVIDSVSLTGSEGTGFSHDGAIPDVANGAVGQLQLHFEAMAPGPAVIQVDVDSNAGCTEPLSVQARAFLFAGADGR